MERLVGYILRLERLRSCVVAIGYLVVTFHPNQRKLTRCHPWSEVGHSNALGANVAAQVIAKLFYKGFGGAIHMPTWIRRMSGDRTQINDR